MWNLAWLILTSTQFIMPMEQVSLFLCYTGCLTKLCWHCGSRIRSFNRTQSNSINIPYSKSISLRTTLKVFYHLLDFPSTIFHHNYIFLISPDQTTCQAHCSLLQFTTLHELRKSPNFLFNCLRLTNSIQKLKAQCHTVIPSYSKSDDFVSPVKL